MDRKANKRENSKVHAKALIHVLVVVLALQQFVKSQECPAETLPVNV